MRPFWSGRTMLCAPEGDGGGAGGNTPAPSPAPSPDPTATPAPAPAPKKKDDDPPKGETPVDTVVRDVARIKKKIGLDEDAPAPAPKKAKAGLSVFSLFDKDE